MIISWILGLTFVKNIYNIAPARPLFEERLKKCKMCVFYVFAFTAQSGGGGFKFFLNIFFC